LSDLALLADVGGTNVRFALADPSAGTPLLQDSIQPYAVADFPSLADAARHYLDASGAHVAQGVFAVAGRVEHGQARMTNHSWVVSHTELSAKLKLDALELVNDFVAQAMAVRLLRDEDLMTIGSRAPAAATADPRTCGVLGPGTGLGVAALIVRNGRALALATEGGHIGFAPGTDEEVAVLQRLAARFGHVSNERLVSGGGLVNLHRALAEISGAPWDPAMQPADVTAGADAGDALCLRTIDLFCAVFGSVAGDMALVLGAWDGVFLSGGLVPRLLDELKGKGFRARFEAKGRYAPTLAQVPTAAVVHPQPGLLGAAALACDIASERAR
jgi:glucokinase